MLAHIPVDITGNVHRMWLGCVMGANVWLQCRVDEFQKDSNSSSSSSHSCILIFSNSSVSEQTVSVFSLCLSFQHDPCLCPFLFPHLFVLFLFQ